MNQIDITAINEFACGYNPRLEHSSNRALARYRRQLAAFSAGGPMAQDRYFGDEGHFMCGSYDPFNVQLWSETDIEDHGLTVKPRRRNAQTIYDQVYYLLRTDGVWAAVEAVADAIQEKGSISGKEAASLIASKVQRRVPVR